MRQMAVMYGGRSRFAKPPVLALLLCFAVGCQATCTDACERQSECLGADVHGDLDSCVNLCEKDDFAGAGGESRKQEIIECFAAATCAEISSGECEPTCSQLCAGTCYEQATCEAACSTWSASARECATTHSCSAWRTECDEVKQSLETSG